MNEKKYINNKTTLIINVFYFYLLKKKYIYILKIL